MFEALTSTLEGFFSKIRGRPRLTEKNITDGLREVRLALLEADVHYRVVKTFIERVTEKAVGEEVIRGVNPAQQIVKIVRDEVEALMGPVDHSIAFNKDGLTVLMLAGLQGSGKTTTCGKLAQYLRDKYACTPMLVAADVQRPAAIDQLEVLGRQIHIPVVSDRNATAAMVCMQGRARAMQQNCNVLILDTAGRLHVDDEMMEELRRLKRRIKPDQLYLVVDAMTGQDAVVSAQEFNRQLEFDAAVLTKLDGDARGGAALSIKAVTGKPIKFVGLGEKLDKFEEFRPERMADRILGMGDVVTFVEKAQEAVEAEDAQKLEEKLRKATFDLEDFRTQIRTIKRMGPIREILGYLPFVGDKAQDMDFDEKEIDRVEAIINSMTGLERSRPELISASRRQRIALGSGTRPEDVNLLLKQFKAMRKVMRKVTRGNMGALLDMMPQELGPPAHETLKRHAKKGKKRKRRKR